MDPADVRHGKRVIARHGVPWQSGKCVITSLLAWQYCLHAIARSEATWRSHGIATLHTVARNDRVIATLVFKLMPRLGCEQ